MKDKLVTAEMLIKILKRADRDAPVMVPSHMDRDYYQIVESSVSTKNGVVHIGS